MLKLGPPSLSKKYICKCETIFFIHVYICSSYTNHFIYFTSFYSSVQQYESTIIDLAPMMCGFTAQLEEHHTGTTEVTGLNPAEAMIFFRPQFPKLLKLENSLHICCTYICSSHMNLLSILYNFEKLLLYCIKKYDTKHQSSNLPYLVNDS